MQVSASPEADAIWDFYRSDKEVTKSRRRTEEWTIPALKGFYPTSQGVRVLSVGCGSAVDVAVLREHGYDCWGTDLDPKCHPGARTTFVEADACSLPFESGYFDATMCLETFEHVGAPNTNSQWRPRPEYRVKRKQAADELLRVTRPGGIVIIVTPNRFFPIDEHGPGRTGLGWHMPFRDMTLSYFELKRLIVRACDEVGVLPYGRYFQLEKLEKLGGAWLARLVDYLLPLFSNRILHISPLGPHLFVYFRKSGASRMDREAGTRIAS